MKRVRIDNRLYKLGNKVRVYVLATGLKRHDWMAVVHMGFFAVYHRERSRHPWGLESRMTWVEKKRIPRRRPYNGKATYDALTDFTSEELMAVTSAMERLMCCDMASLPQHALSTELSKGLTQAIMYGYQKHGGSHA